LLEGRNVNLRVAEKEDLPLLAEWANNLDFWGEYFSPLQRTKADVEKTFESSPSECKNYIVEKKDGTKIGGIVHFNVLAPYAKTLEMGYALVPSERGKGYCTEAAQLMVDYLFLSKDITCVQATIVVGNVASQRVLEKAGFQKEGIMRKRVFINGKWRDLVLFSILREEWKEPKVLTKTA
jgi:ribosomal-protein-alanine N-acetyltransferase